MQQPKAMTTEAFLRREVFRQPISRSMGREAITQAGADDKIDMTPDNILKYQRTDFATPKGIVFGVMELFRNDEGQITRCNTIFNHKKKVLEYAYDNKGRLAAVKTDGVLSEQYQYGSRGERLWELNGTRYVFNYLSQLEQVRSLKGNITFVYDDRGRVVQKRGGSRVTTFGYNTYGFLERICLPDSRCITYTYDPLGRRSSKLVNGNVTEKYCWKDMLCLQAACTGDDKNHVVFNYEESEKNRLQPASLSCNGKEYFLAYNHVGTLLAIADEAGSVVHIEETDSFGRRLSHNKFATVAMISFGGGQLDDDTGLVHFLFRDYDPATGFFIQQDPLGRHGGDADVYGYCLDDPVNLVDPLGLKGGGIDASYLKKRAGGLGRGFDDAISFFDKFTPTTPLVNLIEEAFDRDLDQDGDASRLSRFSDFMSSKNVKNYSSYSQLLRDSFKILGPNGDSLRGR
ncbi:RHS repeat domain-containing protein [Halodesulfovibrio spirochaetisodalis]|uniref:RHS repeat domain-containing protein n=1 Tax=Halodesulfovibrio spirochaetisodalis TaxID=1560234 RepID=UPI0008378F7B|nr:RHS repeat-associated core domain-containing protein [Halodesulfovibrio spirochaetisodalis]